MKMKKYILSLTIAFIAVNVNSQTSTEIIPTPNDSRVITTGVPFLLIASDARAASMGDMGVATSVDTYSQTVMPSLHSAGWKRRHLDWEFKLAENDSEPDEALVEGIINATESFLRSSEVHRLFIQELVQGTFEEANDKKIISKAIKSIIEEEIVLSLREKRESLLKKISEKLVLEEKISEELAINSAKEGFEEVERLLANHSEAV